MRFKRDDLQAGFRIGEYLIEPRQNRIVRGDAEVHLEPRVMDVLVCLAESAGEVVSRETLNQRVWGNVVVTDQAVTNCISGLRHHLGDDRSTNRVIETIPKRGYRLSASVRLAQVEPTQDRSQTSAAASMPHTRWLFGVGLLLAIVALGGAWWWRTAATPSLTSVAVLRFENAAGDTSLDYLALALPDEIATLLTKSPDLAVRPIGYVEGDNPLARARERRVDHVVGGRFYLEDDGELSLAVEGQQVAQERVIWRTRITVPVDDLIAMRGRIAEHVQQGLLPALGASARSTPGSKPSNDAAYQLYLRALAMPQQPRSTEKAVEMLEQVVKLDPTFAPAWHALGRRLYDYGTYGAGAAPARERSLAAHRKALELDPHLIEAARNIVTHRTETADLEGAYHEARRLLDQFGPGADTYFTLSYVYRYGGLLEASQQQCELALERDPQNPRVRSCGYAYLYAGKLDRVMDFVMLDEGSYFSQWVEVLYLLRLDDRDAALHITRQAADEPTRRLMQPCLEGQRGEVLDDAAAQFAQHWERSGDPEAPYAVAPMLLYCGYPKDALRLVERAVDGSFCSYPALDQDPIWSGLRSDAEFQRIRVKAMACHDRFRRMVDAYGGA